MENVNGRLLTDRTFENHRWSTKNERQKKDDIECRSIASGGKQNRENCMVYRRTARRIVGGVGEKEKR